MIIRANSICSLNRHFRGIKAGTKIILSVRDVDARRGRLTQVGLTAQLESGESALPA